MPCRGFVGFWGIWPEGMPPGPNWANCIACSRPGGILPGGNIPGCIMPAGIAPAGKPAAIIGQDTRTEIVGLASLGHTPDIVDLDVLQADMPGQSGEEGMSGRGGGGGGGGWGGGARRKREEEGNRGATPMNGNPKAHAFTGQS